LNEIILFDERNTHKGLFARFGFIRLLKKKKFDTVFLLHKSMSRAFITWAAGIPERIGYDTKKRGFLLTRKIIPPAETGLHRAEYYLELLKRCGLNVKDVFADFPVSAQDTQRVETFLAACVIEKSRFLVGINPGGNWNPKRWQKEYFALLADRLIVEFGATVLITGGLKDSVLAEDIQRLMRRKAFSCCGEFDLKQFGALCKKLDLLITADSGPLHIAHAVHTKNIIALFGPTHPALTGPYPPENVIFLQKNVGCKIPCYIVDCPDNRCMKAITPDDVIEKVRLIRG
jgi:lipopolysaccharide heptosyltransferase II